MRIRSAVLLGFATLLFACTEQPTGYPPSYSSSDGPEYATPASPAYGYAPGYPALNNYGSDVFLGGGGYWAGGEEPDRYWYHRRRHREGNRQELLRHENETQARAQAWQQLQQQKAAIQAAQAQTALQQQQQRAAAQAAQAQALQERAQAVQQLYQQRAQAVAAQQQAISAARARGLAQ
jgi:hypothetical protein